MRHLNSPLKSNQWILHSITTEGRVLQSQECLRRGEACEERGVEVDEGWRDGDEEVVWLTVLLLFSMKEEEDKAPLAGWPSCWDLEPIIKRLRYPLFLTLHRRTPHLFCSDLARFLFALAHFTEGACTHNWLIMFPKTLKKKASFTRRKMNTICLLVLTLWEKTEQIHEGDSHKGLCFYKR